MNSSLFGSDNSEIESLDDDVSTTTSELISDEFNNNITQAEIPFSDGMIVEESTVDDEPNILPVSDDNHKQFYVFKCRDCSSTFGKYGSNDVNHCAYCGGTNLDNIDDCDDDFPYMIPFNYSLDDAVNCYKKYVGFNPLIPNIFKSKKTISSISKIFVSSELFDINISGNVSFFAGDRNVVNDIEELKKYDVKNTVNFDFKDVLMCGNSKISMPIFLGISDYDFQKVKQYDSTLIADSSILLSDLSPMDISNYASNMVMDYSLSVIRKNVNHQLKKVNKNNIGVNFSNNKSILVPIYLLNVSYKGHTYTYIMNGSNGKTTMKIVYGKKEVIILSVVIFILLFALSFLFVYFI